MACPKDNVLAAFASNGLDETERAAIAEHAASCTPCHAVIAELLASQTSTGRGDEPKEAASTTLRPGDSVGRYLIERTLGAGGMGVVHAAVDSELQRLVALKVLRPEREIALGTMGRERLRREARALALLSHPNVVTIYDVGEHRGQLYIAMELIDGGNLSAWLARAPRSSNEIIDRLLDAARGIAAAHAAGVVHRDIKPENILVGLDGRARVTDFGLAQLADDATPPVPSDRSISDVPLSLTRSGTLLGTPAYMSPEQRLSAETDARSDQWSFFVTLYEALAGVKPFAIEDAEVRAKAVAEGRLQPPAPGRRLPSWMQRIIARGLRADPAERWPSMDAVVDAIARGHAAIGRRMAVAIAVLAAMIGAVIVVPRLSGASRTQAELERLAAYRTIDGRPGCQCPYSTCRDGCESVCRAPGYSMGAVVPGISVKEQQDTVLGVSGDGDTILYLTGPGCSLARLMIARRRGSTFESIDLTDQLDVGSMKGGEGCCTLSADAKTIVLPSAEQHGFFTVSVGEDGALHPEQSDLGALIPEPIAKRVVRFPVLSADRKELYYTIEDPDPVTSELASWTGTYVASREDLHGPFASVRRLPAIAQRYEYATGISADGLTLFMASDFSTRVLARATVSEPFGGPAPLLPGWRAKPLRDCMQLVTTMSPGGCRNEDIVYLDADR